MKTILALFLLVGGLTVNAETFNFNFTGQNFNASGTITGDLISPGVYQVTGMSGILSPWHEGNPLNVISLASPGEINGADNLLYTNEPFVDSQGINFFVGDGSIFALAEANIGYQILGCFEGGCMESQYIHNPGDLVVSSAVPEPTTLLLVSSGIVALAARLKRFRSA
jgi:hypothetical protein